MWFCFMHRFSAAAVQRVNEFVRVQAEAWDPDQRSSPAPDFGTAACTRRPHGHCTLNGADGSLWDDERGNTTLQLARVRMRSTKLPGELRTYGETRLHI